MLNFFGISKKDKVSVKDTANLFSVALNKVVNDGFPEIQTFLNNNNNLEKSPEILDEEIKWFRLIIFSCNLHLLSTKFEENEALSLRNHIVDELMPFLEDDIEIAMDLFLNYETYFNEIIQTQVDPIDTMTVAVFDKYNINECQSELLKRKNEPNPVLFNELRKYLSHFIWNWDEFLEKCKITF
tara:strand:+ start:1650 stop:2201 length:552 start_codon:yes stop_codon:yes gene_type:complete